MYAIALNTALAALLLGGVALLAWLRAARRVEAWRNTALTGGIVADVVATAAAVWHLVAEHGATTPAPMGLGEFVAAHPAVIVVALAANVFIAGAIVARRRSD